MKITERRKQECIKALKEMVRPGDTVYTKLNHVSRSGMYRAISLYLIKDNEPVWITRLCADLLEGYDERHEGARAHGCGMDMGFHIVHNLGYVLFKDGFGCTGKGCPSNDHSNGDRNYEPNVFEGIVSDKDGKQYEKNTHWHKSGGYALKQRWL
jgi:hypothetical protein